jgi:DNA invertase Pin-like site-specific DNA recombinase
MKIGYQRVSTLDQNLVLQTDALTKDGCEKIFTDTISGSKTDRPGLAQALAYARPGEDTLVVWKLDRLGRSLPHLLEVIAMLDDRGIGFRSLTESLDTTTPGGRLLFHIMGALAQFERDLIKERTSAGLEAARSRGKKGGRPSKLTPQQKALLFQLANERDASGQYKHERKDLLHTFKISEPTYYRIMWEMRKPPVSERQASDASSSV